MDKEILNFGISEFLSATSLAVAIMAALYSKSQSESAKKQSEFAKISSMNDYRAQLAVNHARYRCAHLEIKNKHKSEIRNLSQLAGDSLTAIVHRFDKYDIRGHGPRPLRHLLHESSEMVFYAFRGELSLQTGLNISHRFYQITRIETDLKPSASNFGGSGFRRVFMRKSLAQREVSLELDLPTDQHFCNLVSELKLRVDPSRRAEALMGMQADLAPFRAEHERMRAGLRESAEYLSELIDEGSAEHFPLSESADLLDAMMRQAAVLDTLSCLHLPVIEAEFADRYADYISQSIYACAVLHAIQGIHSWGYRGK